MSNYAGKIKTCAVIPFYNEEKFIRIVIEETIKSVDKVIAVNDGSTDSSLKKIVRGENVEVINLPRNKGKGYALKTGMIESVRQGFSITVTLDADLQHAPGLIPDFIRELKNSDIVIGNRLENLKGMPVQRILSNKLTSLLLSIKTGIKIADSQCGYRAYRTSIITDILTTCDGFEAESEIIIKAALKNYRISSTMVSTVYGEEESKIDPAKSILGFIKIMLIRG